MIGTNINLSKRHNNDVSFNIHTGSSNNDTIEENKIMSFLN